MNVITASVVADHQCSILKMCQSLYELSTMCCRYYREEGVTSNCVPEFGSWLRRRCASMAEADQVDCPELMALSLPPSKKVCAFSGMKSFGAHYRVDMEQGGPRHVTFDSGVHSRLR